MADDGDDPGEGERLLKSAGDPGDTEELTDDIEEPAALWWRYWTAAVMEFSIGAEEAWRLTVKEWWMLYDWKFGDEAAKRSGSITRSEARRMARELDEINAREAIEAAAREAARGKG